MQLKVLGSSAALWLALTGSVFAAEIKPVDHLLQRLQNAQKVQSYQGAFIYERKGAFSTHQIWRQMNPQGQLVERFLQLNGPEHEVVRINGSVVCMTSAIADQLAGVDMWPAETTKLEHLRQWYEVLALGETRVAGQMTTVLLFSPNDQHRYPVELYLDQATAIPLKTLLLNEQGQLLERLQFIQFQAHANEQQAVDKAALVAPSANCVPIVESQEDATEDAESDHNNTDLHPSWVPPGFVLLKSHYKPPLDSDSSVVSQVYSDGLAHFSVFFENIDSLELEGGRRQLGPTAVVSRKIQRHAQDLMVTVMGEIPLGSAERIALSMQADQERTDD